MPRSTLALVLFGIALLLALLTSLVDWVLALTLLAALAFGWAIVVAIAVARPLYDRHRVYVLGAAGVIVLALLVVLRPDGSTGVADANDPLEITAWDGELWPRRVSAEPSFILRERHAAAGGASATGANGASLPVRRSGLLAHEIRFAPGASTGSGPLRLADGGRAMLVVNPIEDGLVIQVPRGEAARVDLPDGEVVRVSFDRLPASVRMTYATGIGRTLRPLLLPALPLRSLPAPIVILLFAVLGAAATHAAAPLLVDPLRKRFERRPEPPTRGPRNPGAPAGPIERAPLVPRRK